MSAAPAFVALRRRLGPLRDPLALHAALAGSSALSAVALDAKGDGLLALDPLLRIRADAAHARIEALTPAATALLAPLASALVRVGETVRRDAAIEFRPAPGAPDADEPTRLRAPSVLDALRAAVLAPGAFGGVEPDQRLAIGVLGHDLVDAFERLPRPRHADRFPDIDLFVPATFIEVIGGEAAAVALVPAAAGPAERAAAQGRLAQVDAMACLRPNPPPEATPCHARARLDDAGFAALVRRLQEEVRAGEVFQVVASRAFDAPCPDPLAAHRRLHALNPSRHAFCLRTPERTVFGCSPEDALAIDAAGMARLAPIAGTRARARGRDGAFDHERDARLLAELHLDAKELAEHVMLVDLARNDLARVCAPGTRRVAALMQAIHGSHVMHLGSVVEGRLAEGLDALHAYRACANMGTLTGAPKLRAMELLREAEADARGAYGGAFALLRGDGSLDSAIVIRAAEVVDGVARVQAGAGIVLDSDPEREADETRRKAAAVLQALGAAEAATVARAAERAA